MKQLKHRGILIPPKPEWKRLYVTYRGKRIDLTPEQEEMAIAWAKKLDTEYSEDPVFAKNFLQDFCKALGLKGKVTSDDLDFSNVGSEVQREKRFKLSLTKEEKKRLAEQRKAVRERNKDAYGFAIVDGARVEVANYMAEPSSIFMGRGKHPLRGRWKQGPSKQEITLNLSPDTPRPAGKWRDVVWQPDSMWIAKWKDKLRGKEKYVWLADSSPLKQKKDVEKFDKATELAKKIGDVRKHITANLGSGNTTRRKVATVCYLIDVLKLRVGDEKDKDEADTVGATTLRPEHVRIGRNRVVTFDFLGKDAVRWQKRARLPQQVISNLREFMESANSSIFEGVKSQNVSVFLNEVLPALSSKVFRTYHASKVVDDFLKASETSREDPEHEKKHVATMANLEAAIVCNHKRKPRKNWRESLAKKRERLKKLKAKDTASGRMRARILRYQIEAFRETKEYNLSTSLKSYIDPRIYYRWGREVDFDWKRYYPKALQKKFSWVDPEYQTL
jgi:DNA topoisomerase-1